MGTRIALYNSNLFSIDSCDLLPSSQYMLNFAQLNSKLFSPGDYVLSPVIVHIKPSNVRIFLIIKSISEHPT